MSLNTHIRGNTAKQSHHGFTLIEVMVVVSIIGLLMGVVVTSVNGALASQRLTSAARQLSADLQRASMIARKENRPVEIRFFKLPPAEQAGSAEWRAYQIALVKGWDASGVAITRHETEMQYLPQDVILSSAPEFSFLESLHQSSKDETAGATPAEYASYFVHSNGSTTLPADTPAVLTFIRETGKGSTVALPKNFRSIVIDTRSHQSRVY